MKLKYYLRGLGAGILFSVLVFVFVVNPKETTLSDEEIIQRAKMLGMTEKQELSIDMEKLRENTPSPETMNSGIPSPSPTSILSPSEIPSPTLMPTHPLTPTLMPTQTNSPTPTTALSPTNSPTPTPTIIPTPTQLPTLAPSAEDEQKSDNETISSVVEIKSGMRSEDICAVIENAGIIDSATRLNAYLIQNGYAERLRSGKFELNSTMTYDQIAKLLTW